MICIGIDPDKGWAVWNTESRKFVEIQTVNFWEIINKLQIWGTGFRKVKVYCEDPSQNRPVWIKIPDIKDPVKRELAEKKAAQNVGENKAKAKLIVEYCEKAGIEVIKQKPSKKSKTKMKAPEFEFLTGWKGRTSEHGRDAAMLVWGL